MDARRGRVEITRRGDDREGTAHQREPALEGQHEPGAGGGCGRPSGRGRGDRACLDRQQGNPRVHRLRHLRQDRREALRVRRGLLQRSHRQGRRVRRLHRGVAGVLRRHGRVAASAHGPDVLRRRGELPLQAGRRRRRGAPGRGHRGGRPDQQVLPDQLPAPRLQLLLEPRLRTHPRRGGRRRRGPAHHARAGPQHGLDAQVHRGRPRRGH